MPIPLTNLYVFISINVHITLSGNTATIIVVPGRLCMVQSKPAHALAPRQLSKTLVIEKKDFPRLQQQRNFPFFPSFFPPHQLVDSWMQPVELQENNKSNHYSEQVRTLPDKCFSILAKHFMQPNLYSLFKKTCGSDLKYDGCITISLLGTI